MRNVLIALGVLNIVLGFLQLGSFVVALGNANLIGVTLSLILSVINFYAAHVVFEAAANEK